MGEARFWSNGRSRASGASHVGVVGLTVHEHPQVHLRCRGIPDGWIEPGIRLLDVRTGSAPSRELASTPKSEEVPEGRVGGPPV